MIERIENKAFTGHAGERFLGEEVIRRVANFPELRHAWSGNDLPPHLADTAELITLFLFPPGEQGQLYKISQPFEFLPVYSSPAMRELMRTDEVCYCFGEFATGLHSLNLVQAGLTILEQCYGKEIEIMPISRLKSTNRESGQVRYFRPRMNLDYVRVNVKGKLPELSEEDYHRLVRNFYDRDLWLELLPPEKFSFEGFMFGMMTDITSEEALSQLKQKLLHREAILNLNKVKELADLLRLHFQLPELQLGLTALDYPVEFMVNHRYRIQYHLLSGSFENLADPAYEGGIYHQALESKQVVMVEDITELDTKTPLEWALLEKGFKSIIIAPLINKHERVIGLVELGSPRAYQLNAFVKSQFMELLSLFRTTLVRSREDVDNRLEAIIREKYTSLHPSVEWKFMEAAFNMLEQQSAGEEIVPEAISFSEVYPLFAQADIVSSSRLRNEAIHADLIENLEAARLVLVRALDLVSFPLVSQTVLEIDKALGITSAEFNNSHETSIVELLLHEVNPLIRLLGKELKELCPLTKEYFAGLDPKLNLIYNCRKDYEESVSRLNKELGIFFEAHDRKIQQRLPHYFEQYKTDGVEYEVYAGKSLLKHGDFSQIHLRNLRLSQLIDLSEATRMVASLQSELPRPLETAQLLFAYTSPLNISFRMDEKRFDVEGAYNIRYEILKKRIDKATINGGAERLTKAGHISIVYLHDKDEVEYNGYLDYLDTTGFIDGEPEYLELDALQSVQGLRAIRFKVNV
ncbi:hypothetical protein CEQ90_18080 [Lewinellaceae bacterium SD302]|nr:hypothetical protein CEQ90_18080 [Lewinellaceae bacterium SD302]